ncbi:MAG: recombination regulator RecX [Herminiimonas sp.]|nr:recombination regulator RecX [Herminiimonas sp.]
MTRPAISLKARALRYLSSREHSRSELARKLARHAQEGDDVEELLDWLVARKFLSQERFCESLINRRVKRFGNSRILAELQSHGVGSVAIAEARADLVAGETARAVEVWQRKFGSPGIDAAARAKQMRFLMQRGFSHQAIRVAMASAMADDDAFAGDTADDA